MKLLRAGAGGAVAAIALSVLTLGPSAYAADATPVVNESFEATTTLPSGWQFAQYRPGVSAATIVDSGGSDGAHFLHISSPTANHARVEIPLTVTAQTTYHFHAQAKSSGADASGPAAVLGVDGQTGVSNSVSSNAAWQPLDVYVKSGSQTSVTFTLSLGNFGHETAGTADFDAVTIATADAVPNGAAVITLSGAAAQGNASQAAAPTAAPTGGDPKNLLYPILIVAVIAAVAGGIHYMRRSDQLRDRAEPVADDDDDDYLDEEDDDAQGEDEPAASDKAGRAGPK